MHYNMTKEIILIVIISLLVISLITSLTYAFAVHDNDPTLLLNATNGFIATPHIVFSNYAGYPAYIPSYYDGINAIQLMYASSYSYGGIAWPITYNGSIIKVSVIGLFSFFHVAPADGFTIILFPSNGSGIEYSNYSIPLFFALSSTNVGGNLQLPYSSTPYIAVQWDPFYGAGNQINLYVVEPTNKLVANPGGIGCGIGNVLPGELINFTIVYIPQLNKLAVYLTNEATGESCSALISLSNYNFTEPMPGNYWLMIEADSGEYYANWAVVSVTYGYLSPESILSNLRINVLNAITGKPITNASIVISSINATCTTNNLGVCYLLNLEPEHYTITISKEGFENKTEYVSVAPGMNNITVWLIPALTTPNEGFNFIGYSSSFISWLKSDVSGMSSIFSNGFAPIGIGVYGVNYVNGDYVGYEYKYDYVVATMIVTKPLNFTTWNAGFYPVPQDQAVIDLQLNFYLVIKLTNGQYQYYWLQNVIGIHYPGEVLIGPPGAFNNTASGASFEYSTMTLSNAAPAVLGFISTYPFVVSDVAKVCSVTPTYVTICFGYDIGKGVVWYSNMTLYPYTTISNAYFEIAPHGAGATPQLDLAFVLTGGYSPGQVYGKLLSGEILTNVLIRLVNGTWIVPQDAWNVGTGTAEEAQAIDEASGLESMLMPGVMKNLTMLWSLPLEVNVTVINPSHVPVDLVNGTYLGGLAIGGYGLYPLNSTVACRPSVGVSGDYIYVPWLNYTGDYIILGPSIVTIICNTTNEYYNVTVSLPTVRSTYWVRINSTFTYTPPSQVSNGTVLFSAPYTIYVDGTPITTPYLNLTINFPLDVSVVYRNISYLVNFITPQGVTIPSRWVEAGTSIVVSGPVVRTSNYTAYPVITQVIVDSPMNITVTYNANTTVVVRDSLGLPAPGVTVTLKCGTKSVSTTTNSLGIAELSLSNIPTVTCNVIYAKPILGYYGIAVVIIVVVAILLALVIPRLRSHSV